MMNFPNAPTDGQQYTFSGRTWEWSEAAGRWELVPITTDDVSLATMAAGEAVAAKNAAIQAASDAADGKALAEGYAQAASESANAAAQSAQEAASIVLGEVFDDENVSPNMGWTSQRIVQEISEHAGTVASVNNVSPDSDGDVSLGIANIPGLEDALDGKVAKVAGKNLSQEDFTSAHKNKLEGIEAGAQVNPTPVDDLTSNSTSLPLSANQGRVLKGLIDAINELLQSDDTTLDELQEIVDYIKLNREDLENLSIASIAGLQSALDNKQPLNPVLTGTTASFTTALLSKLNGIQEGAQANAVTSVAGKTGAVTLAKGDVGLGNVDNTSDADKPLSTATINALSEKVDKVAGKGLSTEDYTTEEKNKLAGLSAASVSDVRAANGNGIVTPALIASASAPAGVLSDSSTIAVNWAALVSDTVTISGNRTLGNPTNVQPGTSRAITVKGNNSTNRTLSFASNYKGADSVQVNNANFCTLFLYAVSATEILVSAKEWS